MTTTFQLRFIIGIFLALNMGCKAVPCPKVKDVNDALNKEWSGVGLLKVGKWSGRVFGSKGIKAISATNSKSFLYGRKQQIACSFTLNNNKSLIICNPGPCQF